MEQSKIQQWQTDIREYEAAHFISNLIGEANTILNVGPSWGRDYYALTKLGKQVVNLDIAPQYHLAHLVIADATQKFPFSTGYFDAVLLPEVLEHLIEDWKALQETHRVLKDNGRLIVTVPFYNDAPDYHVRIHSTKSIVRLLAAAGFTTTQLVYRGGWIRVPRLVHGVRKFLTLFQLNQHYYNMVISMDKWWGKQHWASPLAKGVYILAYKGELLDWRKANIEEFQHL